jgi:HEAT repeat protein
MEMPEQKAHKHRQAADDDRSAQESGSALSEVYKALKALTFYPERHPLREEILHRAYRALLQMMQGTHLHLLVHRNGLSIANRDSGIENSRMTTALAKELFSREIQRLTILPEISAEDFNAFLSLLSMESQKIVSEGGMRALLEQAGVRTVISNEIDIAAVFTKHASAEGSAGNAAEESGSRLEMGEKAGGEGARTEELPVANPADLTFQELIELMEREPDDLLCRELARMLVAKGEVLKREGEYDTIFPVILRLLNQNSDETRSPERREVALSTFRELASGEMTEHLLDHLEDESFRLREIVYLILNHLGGEAVDGILRRIMDTESQFARNVLSTALLRMGPSSIPPLLSLLKDEKWRVARSAAKVLGEMCSREAVKGLTLSAYHIDNRVRIESIRSLARIGGREATDVLIDLLQDNNRVICRQTILWLGITRNERALLPLLEILNRRGSLKKSLTLKKEILLAVGRIGDRRALDSLIRLVRKRHWISPGRWDELKILAVETIGRLGGEASRTFLAQTSVRGGCVGRASAAVLETMEGSEGDVSQ